MRILIHTDEYYPTAQACTYRMSVLAEAFLQRGHEVTVIASSANRSGGDVTDRPEKRGSFTELVHTADCGQVSVNISRPGITKGQHWHNSKWELFIVVAGHGLIQERNINTGEVVEFEVSGDKIEAVHMIPGWTHNIINLSETESLVTVMTCNEIFDPKHPDTFFEPV